MIYKGCSFRQHGAIFADEMKSRRRHIFWCCRPWGIIHLKKWCEYFALQIWIKIWGWFFKPNKWIIRNYCVKN